MLLFAFLLLSSHQVRSEGIEFFQGAWQEALAEAKKQDKIIFVDAYAVWCGPCKRMAAEVFTDKAVGDFYNRHFINVKMDMERGEGLEFRKKYPVSAFPTLMYIDYNGEMVQQTRGARPVDGFIELGRAALGKIDRSGQYVEAYERGDRSPELVYNYIKALNRAGKPTLKITNDYLREQKDLNSETTLRIILEGAVEADSRIFDLLIEHRARIAAVESPAAVEERIRSACEATVRKGLEFQSRELVDQAVAKMKKFSPRQADAFALEADMKFALAVEDAKAYTRAVRDYARRVVEKDDASARHELAQTLVTRFRQDSGALKQAEELAADAARYSEAYGYHLTYAIVLAYNGKKDEARQVARHARELARKEGDQAVKNVENFLMQLDGKGS